MPANRLVSTSYQKPEELRYVAQEKFEIAFQ